MTTIQTTPIPTTPVDTRVDLWKKSGETDDAAKALANQEFLLKMLKDMVEMSASTNIKELSSLPAQVVKLPDPALELPTQVVQLPGDISIPKEGKLECMLPPQVIKGKVEKAKKELKCCKNGALIISFFPIIGPILANICKIHLAKKIKNTAETEKISELTQKMNKFRIAAIASTLMTVALVVNTLVVGLLFGGMAFFIGLGAVAVATAVAIPLVTFDSVKFHQSTHPKIKLPGDSENTKQKSPRKSEETIKTEKTNN